MSDNEHPTIKAFVTCALIVSAVSAYFLSPLWRYANLDLLTFFGVGLGIWASIAWMDGHKGVSEIRSWIGACAVIAMILGLAYVVTTAQGVARANDARCASIQREMLLPNPRRADLPDLFSALGCRPQGRDDVQFPSRPQPKGSPAGQPTAKAAP